MDYLPTRKDLMQAIIEVYAQTNKNSLTSSEMDDKVAKLLNLSNDLLEIEDNSCSSTEFKYRMRWARTNLKNNNIIINKGRGLWELVPTTKSSTC